MTRLTRRTFALGAAAAPLSIALGQPGAAQSADGSGDAAKIPALFDAPLGQYRITSIFDGMVPLTRELFSGLPEAEVTAALEGAGLFGEALSAPVTAFLLQSEERTILIDAGMGDIDAFGDGLGRLAAGLGAMGVAPADVDTVILTHAHLDHLGGLVSGGAAVFENAELVMSDVEHGFWSDAAAAAAAPADFAWMFGLATGVFSAYGDRLRLVASGTEIAPGIQFEVSPGHTPGHGVVHVDGGDRSLLMVADTLHNVTLHTALPTIGFGFDTDSALAAQSRLKIFDRVAADGLLVAATHAHFPGFGRIVHSGDAYRYVPASWA